MKKLIYILPFILLSCEKYDDIEIITQVDTVYVFSSTNDTITKVIVKKDSSIITKTDTIVIKTQSPAQPINIISSLQDSICGVYTYTDASYNQKSATFTKTKVFLNGNQNSVGVEYQYTLSGTVESFTLAIKNSSTYNKCTFTKQGSILSNGVLIFSRQ